MRTNMSIRRAAGLTAVAGLAACVSTARGAIINWNNAAGGAASTAANWNPALVPTAADTLVYNLNATYTVTFNNSVPLSTQHTYKRGTVTLSLSSPHTLSGNFRVGDVSGDVATTILTTGVVNAASVTVGNAAGSAGTLNITDSDADLVTTGSGDIVVASAGTGTMSITGGGKAAPGDDFIIGNAGGDGTVNVSGFGVTPVRFSNITTAAADGDIVVGNASGSTGELNIFGSGAVGSSDDVQVGHVGGSNGIIDVGGPSGGGTLNVAGDLQIGNNSSSTTAGSGFVTALADGAINVAGVIRLGDTAAGSGTLSCREGGLITASSIFSDDDGGFLNLLGGEVRVIGGTLAAPNDTIAVNSAAGENPALRLQSGASCSLSSTAAPFRALTLGNTERGTLVVDSGSSLSVTNGDTILGALAGSNGFLYFTAGTTGTFNSAGKITLGASGFGGMDLITGANVTAGAVELGAANSGSGALLVNGHATTLTLSGKLSIGGTSAAAFGAGDVIIEDGATLTTNLIAATGVEVWGSGDSLIVRNGGTLSSIGDVSVRGDFTLDGGTIESALQIEIQAAVAGTIYPFSGTVLAQLALKSGSPVLQLTEPLSVICGNAAAIFNPAGTVTVGNHTLTLESIPSSKPVIGNCTIGPAGVITSDRPLDLFAGKTLSGDGTINADIDNAGTITATGDGLAFGGIVHGVGQGMNGVRFTFASGGGFTGAGTINAKIVGQVGSKLTFTANSSVGDGTTAGFATDGEIEVTAGTLTLNDSNGTGGGTLTTLRSGTTIACPSAFNITDVPVLEVVQGFGIISAPSISNTGLIRPGDAAGDRTGTLTFVGNLNLFSGTGEGEVQIDLGGTASTDRDRVSVTGPIVLDGTLTVNLIDGFAPANGFSALVMSATQSISGSFLTFNLPPRWHAEIGGKDVVVVYCAADVNGDGFVNGDDFDNLASAFENGEPLGDFNGDGFINGDDFDEFASAFEEGC